MAEFGKLSREELAEAGRKGGRAKAENARKRKEMKEALEVLLAMSIKRGKEISIDKMKAFAEINGKNITVNDALMVRLIQRGLQGDLKAVEMIRDTIGEKPVEQVHVADVTPVVIAGEDDLDE